jgi:hypothetical protein
MLQYQSKGEQMDIATQSQQLTDGLEDSIARWDDEGGAPVQGASKATVRATATLTRAQRRIVHRLGLAVVIGWNSLPMKFQKALFKSASTHGSEDNTHKLAGELLDFYINIKMMKRALEGLFRQFLAVWQAIGSRTPYFTAYVLEARV